MVIVGSSGKITLGGYIKFCVGWIFVVVKVGSYGDSVDGSSGHNNST